MKRKRWPGTTEPNLFAVSCDECGRQLVGTPSGFLACPAGHGALRLDAGDANGPAEEEPSGLWFEESTPARDLTRMTE